MFFYQPQIDLKPHEVLVYLRKSRSDDPTLTVEETLAKHENMLDDWAEKNLGAKVPEENKYREVGSGETLADRPEVQKLLKAIESPKYQAVLIMGVERLSRGDLEDAGRLIKLFRYTNTVVITYSPAEFYDIRRESDRERFERELKRGNEYLEYTKKIQTNGRLLSVSQGNYLGQTAPYGYNKTSVVVNKRKCPTLEINEEQAAVVRMIFDMYVNQDMGRTSIAHKLDELGIKPPRGKMWSPAALKDMLENVHYLGKIKWNWRKTITIVEDGEIKETRPKAKVGEYLVYEGKHPAIISEELFNAAQDKQMRKHSAKPGTKVRNPFAGLLYCRCGRCMSYRINTLYNGTKQERLMCNDQVHCGTGSARYSEVFERVCNILEDCIEDFEIRLSENTEDAEKLHAKLIKSLEKQLDDLKAKELSQWELQADPDPAKRMPAEIFEKLNAKLLKDKETIQEALCKAYESMPKPVDYGEKIIKFRDALDALRDKNVDAAKKNRLLKACIARIDYSREKPVRIPSQQIMYYDPETKKTRYTSPLGTGANWSDTPIELDVKLRV